MDETSRKGGVGEAIFGLILIFGILIFVIYRFGFSDDTVVNEDLQKTDNSLEQLETKLNTSSENDVYNKYLKQIYETQTGTGSDTNKVDSIVSNYEKELLETITIPTQEVYMKNVSSGFNPQFYSNNFEIIYSDFLKKGGTGESKILLSQITEDNDLLVLSEDDQENLLRTAEEYKIFAEKIQNLSTPTTLEKKAQDIARSALNVSYILKQLAGEKDKKIYTLWISEYSKNLFVIMTIRYSLHEK